MSTSEKREEILDLLARGKISIDEAVEMLDITSSLSDSAVSDEPVYKAEVGRDIDPAEEVEIKIDDQFISDEVAVKAKEKQYEEAVQSEINSDSNGKQARWLRVQVVNTETGKNKVTVNIPFGMVKFGLGVARVFSPEIKGIDLDEMNEVFSNAEAGLLVDVQDDESNEHVKIYFD